MSQNLPANIPRWKRVLGLANVASERKDLYGYGLTLVTGPYMGTTLGETAKGYSQAIRYGFTRNELIYACIMTTADATASVSLKVYDGRHNEIEGHPLRQIITHPNPRMTEFDFWSLNVITNKLSGHGFWEIIRSEGGIPVQLWPLRPDWMAPIRDSKTGDFKYWRFGPPGMDFKPIPDKDVIDFNLLHPQDPIYGGLAPVEVLSRTGDADNAATDFLKGFFENGAQPAGILSSDQRLDDETSDFIRENWRKRYAGWRNWMEPAVLGMGAKYQRIGFDFQEMGFAVLDERAETRICMVMGVPPTMVGANGNIRTSPFANGAYADARLAWWEDHLYPMFRHYQDIIETQLANQFGSGFEVDWDFSKVPALQDDQAAVRQHALAAFTAGGIMQDELRATMGLDPLPDDKGKVFFIPNTITVTPLADLGNPPAPPPAAAGMPALPDADGDYDGDTDAPADNGTKPDRTNETVDDSQKALGLPAYLIKAAGVVAPDDATRLAREADLEDGVDGYFKALVGRVAGELANGAR